MGSGVASWTSSSFPTKLMSCWLRANSTFSMKALGVRRKLHTAIPENESSMASEPGRMASITGLDLGMGSMKDASPASPNSS